MGCLCPSKKKKIENNLLENSENMDDESSNASIKKKTKNFNEYSKRNIIRKE